MGFPYRYRSSLRTYNFIDNGERYQAKRIKVKPGEKLCVQKHHFRAEYWIVVSGAAKVTNQDKVCLLAENKYTYVPVCVVHALENPELSSLEIIEIQ
jgi:mannose-1-phosphate guanylyltransferase